MQITELIDLIDINFSEEEQQKVLNILYHEKGAIEHSDELDRLLKIGVLEEAGDVRLEYKIEKYLKKHGYESISQKKEFIYKFISDFKGLKNGKRANYDDLLKFAIQNYADGLYSAVKEIKTFIFTPIVAGIGPQFIQYLSRKITLSKNYIYDESCNMYKLKDDDITNLLILHGVKLESTLKKGAFVNEINLNLSEVAQKYITKNKKMSLFKIILLAIFWPVGLYVLYKNLKQRNGDARE